MSKHNTSRICVLSPNEKCPGCGEDGLRWRRVNPWTWRLYAGDEPHDCSGQDQVLQEDYDRGIDPYGPDTLEERYM